jgi:putative transposase
MHVTQRGVNRCATFVDDVDRMHYLHLLIDRSRKLLVKVHAYVLMSNHVHLLLSSDELGATSRMMRQVGQSYVASFNQRHQRTGTLWEGRFKSCLIGTEDYLLTVYRYIELNPVRAAMVEAPEHYAWSSVHANLGRRIDPLVSPHEVFVALGSNAEQRADAYRTWLREGVNDNELLRIREHLRRERALGNHRFEAMVERSLGRSAIMRPRGRPQRGARPAP